MKQFLIQHKKAAIAIGAVAVVAIWYFASRSTGQAVQYVTAPVERTTIVSSVSGSGQVSPVHKVDIKPQTAGEVAAVKVQVGDFVKEGQTLVVVDQRSARVGLLQANASLESAQANYDRVLSGATTPDIDVSKAAVSGAQASLANTVAQQSALVASAFRTLVSSGLTASPNAKNLTALVPTISGTYMGSDQGTYTITLFTTTGAKPDYYSVTGLENTGNNPITYGVAEPFGTRGLFISIPSGVSISDSWTVSVPNTASATYAANYNAYQSALQNQKQSIDAATQSLTAAQANLALKTSPARPEDVAIAKASVDSAAAALEAAKNTLQNTILSAPFDGQVASVNAIVGAQSEQSSSTVTLITTKKIAEISLNEVDAAHVKVGQKATLTFDALPDLTLTGTVVELDPLGTVSQSVVSYGAQIALDTDNNAVRSGMSASAAIVSAVQQDVLAVPNGALKVQGGEHVVQVMQKDGSVVSRTVTTGVINDTLTEITNGLAEGEEVVTRTITGAASAAASSAGSAGGLRLFGGGGGGGGGNGAGAAARLGR